MIKQRLMATAVGFCLGMGVVSAGATGWPVYDVMRTAKFAGQGVERLLGLVSEYQKTSADDSEQAVLQNKRNIETLPDQKQMLAYWLEKKPEDTESNKAMSVQDADTSKRLEVEEVKDGLKKAYFLDMEQVKDVSVEKEELVNGKWEKETVTEKQCVTPFSTDDYMTMKLKRLMYMEALAKETLSLADGTRKGVAKELSSLKQSETTGSAQIQQIDLMVQTKKAMIEQKIADIYLQTRLMEMEAAGMMMGKSMQLVDNPSKSEYICLNNQVIYVGGNQ